MTPPVYTGKKHTGGVLMRSELFGSAVLEMGEGEKVTYKLLCDEARSAGSLGCELYGVEVEMRDETVSCPRLTASKKSVLALLDRMLRGVVTPSGAKDVVRDWLAQ
jgi:hypothetical protein